MKICFVLPEYNSELTGHSGGVGQLSARLTQKLAELGHDVCVLVGGNLQTPMTKAVESGVTIWVFPSWTKIELFLRRVSDACQRRNITFVSKGLNYFLASRVRKKYARYLLELESKYTFDIIETSDSFGCLSLYTGKVPVCTRLHSSYTLLSNLANAPAFTPFAHHEHHALRKASAYIGVSQTVIGDSEKCFDLDLSPSSVVYNGIDTSRFSPIKSSAGGRHTPFSMVFVANVNHEKGYDTVCALANQLTKRAVNYSIDIYGAGEEVWLRDFLPLLHAATKASVVFHGAIPNLELIEVYASADLLLCPSKYESFGLTMVEAQASGLPVIANDFTAAREILDDGVTGFVIPRDNIGAWVEKIIVLSKDETLYRTISLAARERAVSRFSLERMATETVAVYQKIISRELTEV